MKSKLLAGLIVASCLASSGLVEAGVPSSSDLPLYVYATKKIYCYKNAGSNQNGWIDPGDLIKITQIGSNGWVRGEVPLSKGGSMTRYFPISEFGVNTREGNYTRYAPTNNTYVYRNSNYNTHTGMFGGNESITVLTGIGNSRLIVFKDRSTGRKMMGWVPYWDCWNADQVPKQNKVSPSLVNAINKNTINVLKASGSKFICPIDNPGSKYRKWGSYYSAKGYHVGLDLYSLNYSEGSSQKNTSVKAFADGTLEASGNQKENGNYVVLKHNLNGVAFYSFYAHMNSYNVYEYGQRVTKGQKIGYIGRTGNSAGQWEHLHFGIVNTYRPGSYLGYVSDINGNSAKDKFGIVHYNPQYVIDNGRLP